MKIIKSKYEGIFNKINPNPRMLRTEPYSVGAALALCQP
jgi:hypothetical protein